MTSTREEVIGLLSFGTQVGARSAIMPVGVLGKACSANVLEHQCAQCVFPIW